MSIQSPFRRVAFTLLLLIMPVFSVPASANAPASKDNRLCFAQAGRMYQIDPLLLEAIGRHESRLNPGAVNNKNRNGTTDYGVMQINSIHIATLKKMGVIQSYKDLFDPCLNIQIGSWLLAKHFQVCGVNWNCLGSYNAGFRTSVDELRENYADVIYAIYRKLNREQRNVALR